MDIYPQAGLCGRACACVCVLLCSLCFGQMLDCPLDVHAENTGNASRGGHRTGQGQGRRDTREALLHSPQVVENRKTDPGTSLHFSKYFMQWTPTGEATKVTTFCKITPHILPTFARTMHSPFYSHTMLLKPKHTLIYRSRLRSHPSDFPSCSSLFPPTTVLPGLPRLSIMINSRFDPTGRKL